MTKKSAKAFTLIELMIAIALISVALGWLGFKIPDLLKRQRYEGDVERVVAKILLAEEILYDTQCDLSLIFSKVEEGTLCLFHSPTLSSDVLAKINKDPLLLAIDQVTFNGKYSLPLHLPFSLASGSGPTGILSLQGFATKQIYLPPYLGDAFITEKPPLIHEKTPPYPQELLPAA